MTKPIQAELPLALAIWESRQKSDGILVLAAVAMAILSLVCFAASPGQASGTFLVFSIVTIVLACARLFQSASNVVRLKSRIQTESLLAELLGGETGLLTNRLN